MVKDTYCLRAYVWFLNFVETFQFFLDTYRKISIVLHGRGMFFDGYTSGYFLNQSKNSKISLCKIKKKTIEKKMTKTTRKTKLKYTCRVNGRTGTTYSFGRELPPPPILTTGSAMIHLHINLSNKTRREILFLAKLTVNTVNVNAK